MRTHHLFLAFFTFLLIQVVQAQVSFFDALPPDSVIHVRIDTDLKNLIKEKMDPTYQEGDFTFLNGPMKGTKYEIELRSRGNIRKEVCFFPPIKLKFPKTDIQFHKLKWVNICRTSKDYQEVLLKEYLIYKLYQTLTDISFDVRIFHVVIYDKKQEKERLTSYAFMIEPVKRLAHRTESKEYEPKYMKPDVLDRHYYPLKIVFQYLIANTDWHVENAHNLKFFRTREIPGVVPVPYDFDYSGFVNASYAVPNETLPIKYVTERHNKGHCVTEEEIEEVCAFILSKKEEMLGIIDSFELMEEKSRNRLKNFLINGFEEVENEKLRKRIFSKYCKALGS